MQFKHIEIVGNDLWVSAYGGLFHSSNDGLTWNYVFFGTELEIFYGIYFYNESLGWTGSERGFYKTMDGGNTWNQTPASPYNGRARDIYFVTPEEGWVITGFGIYHTDDGCESWEQSHDRGGWAFSFVSDIKAWAVGDDMLAHMVNGRTWNEQPIPSGSMGRPPYFTDIQFLNRNLGWIGGKTPYIAHTQNGGLDWYEQSSAIDARITALFMLNESLGWAIGWGGHIFRTTSGNEISSYSWSTVSSVNPMVVAFVIIFAIGGLVILYRIRRYQPTLNQHASQDGELL